MAQIDTLTNVGAVVSTDLALILRGGANVLGTFGSLVGQNSTAVSITGGTINGTTIGATTPATVAATTLSTTGAATFGGSVDVTSTIHPMSLNRTGDTAGQVELKTAGVVRSYLGASSALLLNVTNGAFASQMTLSAAGTLTTTGAAIFGGNVQVNGSIHTNLQSLSAWTANTRAIELTTYGALSSNDNTGTAALSVNAYQSSDGGWSRVAGTTAARFQTNYLGEHKWSNAIAGIAGSAISWVDQMTLDASGNLGIGISNPSYPLVVSRTGNEGFEFIPSVGHNLLQHYNRTTAAYTASRSDALSHDWRHSGVVKMTLDASGNLLAGADNTQTLGGASNRWSVVYAGTGTINTSDAREKTAVSALTPDEVEASKQLGKEIGTYKWLSVVTEKGDAARTHIGMTVQRAIEIMTANNLEPMAYGFICYDSWGDEFIDHPAIEAQEATEDAPAVEAVAAWTEQTKTAGDRYGFRYDELLAFIAAGFSARLEALEAV